MEWKAHLKHLEEKKDVKFINGGYLVPLSKVLPERRDQRGTTEWLRPKDSRG